MKKILLIFSLILGIMNKPVLAQEEKSVLIDTFPANFSVSVGNTFGVNVAVGSEYANTTFYYIFYGGPNQKLDVIETKSKDYAFDINITDNNLNCHNLPTFTVDEVGNGYFNSNYAYLPPDNPSGQYSLYISFFFPDCSYSNTLVSEPKTISVLGIDPTPPSTPTPSLGPITTPNPSVTILITPTPINPLVTLTPTVTSTPTTAPQSPPILTPTPTVDPKKFSLLKPTSKILATPTSNNILIPPDSFLATIQAGSNPFSEKISDGDKDNIFVKNFSVVKAIYIILLFFVFLALLYFFYNQYRASKSDSKKRKRKNFFINKKLNILVVFFLSLFLFLIRTSVFATTDTISTSQDWIVPNNVHKIIVEAWGGGGSGGGLSANRVAGRGGGGAGGQYVKKTLDVTSGTTYPIIIGDGGTGSAVSGVQGSDTTFNVSTVVAKGGPGGESYDTGTRLAGIGTTADGIGDTIYAGGSGSIGNTGTTDGGAGGGGAGSTGAGGNASNSTAGIGTSLNGGDGGAGLTSSGNGNPGSLYGGGGGAGASTIKTSKDNRIGGNGAKGLMKITYTANSNPATPTLISPSDTATDLSLTPTFQTVSTDSESENLQYEIKICTDLAMSLSCQTFDQTSSNVGWSGQDVGSSAYSSGTTATYILQVGNSLAINTTYYWKTRAKDYAGSTAWSFTQPTPYSFTTYTPTPFIQSSYRWRNDNGSEGVGTSLFSVGVTYPYANYPYDITTADVNNDGYFDLITADFSISISVFLNNKYGSFSTGVSYPAPTMVGNLDKIISTDINKDGYPDIIAVKNAIVVFTNTGSGSYGTGTTFPFPSKVYPPSAITTADVNKDGYPDLITVGDSNESNDKFVVYLNNGSGGFNSGVKYSTIGFSPQDIVSVDIDNDGDYDLVHYNGSPSTVEVSLNNGSGVFNIGTTYPIWTGGFHNITSADINNDGKFDIITSSSGDINMVFLNTGSGTLGVGTSFINSGNPIDIITADLNNDGKLDLISPCNTNNRINIFLNTGSGNFSTGITYPTLSSNPTRIVSVDINNDGLSDLATVNRDGWSFTTFINTLNNHTNYGTFNTGTTYPTLGTDPRFVTSADVNNDGKSDLISANYNSSNITVFTNTGSGSYGAGTTYPTLGSNPYSVTSADVNKDGKADLITSNSGANNITVFTNTGSGSYGAGTTYPTLGTDPRFVTSADVNNDGKSDLISANYNSSNITVFTNTGSGSYGAGTTYPTIGSNPYSVTSADVNKDGKADLITSNSGANNITVFTNTGSGSYGAGTTYPTLGTDPRFVTSADVNNDGKFDLISANYNSSNITVFTNTGSGTFGAGTTYPTLGSNPYSVTSADVNKDGKADLITSNLGSDNYTVFYNTGSGIFDTGITYPSIGDNPYSIISPDLNNDSQFDLAIPNYDNNVAVFTNLGVTDPSTPASWLAAENVGITNVSPNSNLRLRFSITNNSLITSANFRLQVAPKGGSSNCTDVSSNNFTDITTTVGSNLAVMTTTPSFSNQAPNTKQLTASGSKFIPGKTIESPSNQTYNITLNNSEYTEVEYNFQMTDNVASATSYCFRSVNVGTTFGSYTNIAQLTTITFQNYAPSPPYLPYTNNTTAQTGQQSPVYGLVDHTPAFSAIFDDPNTSDKAISYQLQIGSDSDWASAEIWDSTKLSLGSTCNENSRCSDIVYSGGTSLVDGSTYYWRLKFWDNSDVGGSWSDTQQFSMNSPPSVSLVVINSDTSVVLTENSSIGVSWVGIVTDADGYLNLSTATGKLFRSGVGSGCPLDNNNCYSDISCDFINCDGNSCSALCSADIYFFTEPTDAGDYMSQYYQATIEATDNNLEVGSTISASTTVDVNTLSAFSIDKSLVYGEVFAGSDTGSNNTVATVTNTGNSLINLEITGDYMCTDYGDCFGQKIEPENQQYNLTTFTYGAGTTLSFSPKIINIGISKPTQSPSNSSRNLYWGIGIPSNKLPGNYQGAVTILVD